MISRLIKFVAWALVALLVFVTLCPLQDRPKLTEDPQIERFAAYAALGSALCLAYPRRRILVSISVALLAVALEAAQFLVPGRDPHVRDALAKVAGGLCGVAAALAAQAALSRSSRARPAA